MINVNPLTATGLGATAGGMLGQAADFLATPRRLTWYGLGQIPGLWGGPTLSWDDTASGAGALGRMGMDQSSPLTQALGLGAEIALDPLTYAGGLLGRGLGTAPRLALTDEIARLQGQADEGLRMLAARNATIADQTGPAGWQAVRDARAARADELRQWIDPDVVRGDMGRTYKTFSPEAAAVVGQNPALGAVGPEGMTLTGGLQRQWPWQTEGRMRGLFNTAGRGKPTMRKGSPVPALAGEGRPAVDVMTNVPPPSAAEVDELMGYARSGMGTNPANPVMPGPSAAPVVGEMTTLPYAHPAQQALGDPFQQFAMRTPMADLPHVPMPVMGGLPVDQYVAQLQSGPLAEALARLEMQKRFADNFDAMAALGLGSFGGYQLGERMWG